jgi:hypothetical protein
MNTNDLIRRLIELRHADVSWQDCATELGKSVEELRELSIKLRNADNWRLPSVARRNRAEKPGPRARGAALDVRPSSDLPRCEPKTVKFSNPTEKRPPGRPRSETPSVAVNLRLPPDVAAALRELAAANYLREGVIVSEAMKRTRELSFTPRVVKLDPPRVNVNVRVDGVAYAEFMADRDGAPGPSIALACERLLRELGCTLEKS